MKKNVEFLQVVFASIGYFRKLGATSKCEIQSPNLLIQGNRFHSLDEIVNR